MKAALAIGLGSFDRVVDVGAGLEHVAVGIGSKRGQLDGMTPMMTYVAIYTRSASNPQRGAARLRSGRRVLEIGGGDGVESMPRPRSDYFQELLEFELALCDQEPYLRIGGITSSSRRRVERTRGFEPRPLPWKGSVLQLHHVREAGL